MDPSTTKIKMKLWDQGVKICAKSSDQGMLSSMLEGNFAKQAFVRFFARISSNQGHILSSLAMPDP